MHQSKTIRYIKNRRSYFIHLRAIAQLFYFVLVVMKTFRANCSSFLWNSQLIFTDWVDFHIRSSFPQHLVSIVFSFSTFFFCLDESLNLLEGWDNELKQLIRKYHEPLESYRSKENVRLLTNFTLIGNYQTRLFIESIS